MIESIIEMTKQVMRNELLQIKKIVKEKKRIKQPMC